MSNTLISGSAYECASSRTGSNGRGYIVLAVVLIASCCLYAFDTNRERSYAAFASSVVLTAIIQV